ncbi:MAG: hypothetical protein JKY03_08560 [Aureispira sp.]|nr:hypothetical protein [Aureispira sp.]
MKYYTKELNLIMHPNDILEIIAKEESKGILTLEEVDTNLAAMETAINGKTTGLLLHIASSYTKKEVLKKYSDLDFGIIATALIVNSYASKLVGNLVLTLSSRFSSKKLPNKIFTDKEVAIEWLEEKLAKEKEGL